MTQPRLIGIYAGASGSGKTTAARYLADQHNFAVISFATPLKRMVAAFLNSYGYSPDEVQDLIANRKHEVLPDLKISPRQLMQTLGNEWGRECVSRDVWLKAWEMSCDRYLALGMNVVCDDCRYPNEAALIKEKGGELWRIDRPKTAILYEHSSEGGLDTYRDWDCVLKNVGDQDDLRRSVFELLEPLPV